VTASVWISQTLAAAWSLGFGVFHASSAPVSMPDDGQRQPAFTRVDASLNWAVASWRIQLSGKNLGNSKYYTTGNTLMPQAPRHAILSASYKF
jgi:outer membrane receptor protein involved in Fe transport